MGAFKVSIHVENSALGCSTCISNYAVFKTILQRPGNIANAAVSILPSANYSSPRAYSVG
jgi:hypothetical protein